MRAPWGVLLLAAVGCPSEKKPELAKPPPVEVKASCLNRAQYSVCTEYAEAALANGEEFVKSPCLDLHGEFGRAPCPADQVVGRCAVEGGSTRIYYRELTPEAARADCRDLFSGTFTAE